MEDSKLLELDLISTLPDERRLELVNSGKRAVLSRGSRIQAHEERNWHLYLVDGKVTVKTPGGDNQTYDDLAERAMQPVFSDPRSKQTAIFTTESLVIRFDRKQMEQATEASAGQVEVCDVDIDATGAELMRHIFADFHDGKIPVPSMPEVAVKVQALLKQEDVGIPDLAKLIEQDPSLTGKLLAAANSAGVRGQMEIVAVKEALVRMGLSRAANTVIAIAIKELFEFSKGELREAGDAVWQRATYAATACRILAGVMGGKPLDQEKAFLIGLLHNVGCASLLAYMENCDSTLSSEVVKRTLADLRNVATTLVLEKWNMDDDFMACCDQTCSQTHPYRALLELALHQTDLAIEQAIRTDLLNLPGFQRLAANDQINVDGRLEFLEKHPEISALTGAPVENAA
ncbi:MAG: HDOD domain-containing protein [Pseudomonadota bacterium]